MGFRTDTGCTEFLPLPQFTSPVLYLDSLNRQESVLQSFLAICQLVSCDSPAPMTFCGSPVVSCGFQTGRFRLPLGST